MFKRNCPQCESEIIYKYNSNYCKAKKKNTFCNACRAKIIGLKQTGENNPFYGKKHSKEMKERLSKIALNRDKAPYRTEEFRKKISEITKGENNPNFGISNYQRWLKKYGEEEANKKLEAFKLKTSIANSGMNNSMYGKPSPQGSGNGWSGWYKGFYFRSLRELSFLIELIENDIIFEAAESKMYAIQYKDWKGNNRNYFADYLIESKRLVEIKPKKLWNSDSIQRKTLAAQEFCKKNEWVYELIDPPIIFKNIQQKFKDGEIRFLPKYLDKFKEWERKNAK